MKKALKNIDLESTNRIIEMAWEDRTTFDSIKDQFGLKEQEVIKIMRKNMKRSSFKMWRERVSGRKTKHGELRNFKIGRHRCDRQGKLGN